jgi:hypothetical protein
MAGFVTDFEWWRCTKGYQLVPSRSVHPRGPDEDWILAKADEHEPCRPLEVDNLCIIFANVRTPTGLLDFIKEFGPLTRHFSIAYGESVPAALEQARIFREILHHHRKGPRKLAACFQSLTAAYSQDLGSINLVRDPARGLRLTVTTETLITALWLQLGQKLSGEPEIRECRHCGQFFEAGPSKGRRADSKFCSDEHRIIFNSQQRSKHSRK